MESSLARQGCFQKPQGFGKKEGGVEGDKKSLDS